MDDASFQAPVIGTAVKTRRYNLGGGRFHVVAKDAAWYQRCIAIAESLELWNRADLLRAMRDGLEGNPLFRAQYLSDFEKSVVDEDLLAQYDARVRAADMAQPSVDQLHYIGRA